EQVVGRNEAIGEQMLAHIAVEALPIGAAGTIHEEQTSEFGLSSRHEGQGFVSLVQGPKSSREEDDGVRLPDEHQLAGEKIPKGDQFLVAVDDWIRPLFPRPAELHS